MRIAVTGSRGFVGQGLVDFILDKTEHEIVALSRRDIKSKNPRIEFRKVDFFSMREAELALRDCDVGVYLIHSMLPSNRLNQGSFADFDFLLADNFSRAAKKNKLQQILYVGGIFPDDQVSISKHLHSRREVEGVLASSGVPVTVLRSSLIIGSRGSSFLMLKKLVYRLPSMGLPAWANTLCQPIYIHDLLHIVHGCLMNKSTYNQSFDCGSPEVLSYRQLIAVTAKTAGLKRRLVDLPNIPVWFSKLWVCLITGASSKLVSPLVDSLTTPMLVAADRKIPDSLEPPYTSMTDAIGASLPNKAGKRETLHSHPNKAVRSRNEVRSVQRLPAPNGLDALAVSEQYLSWLPKFFSGVVYVESTNSEVHFKLLSFKSVLLRLSFAPDRSSPDRQLFYISGGLLAQKKQKGRLEFRVSPDSNCLFAAIHDYRPSLPWWIYLCTQALVHKFVMFRFGRYLQTLKHRPDQAIEYEKRTS